MITIKKLKEELEKFPEDALCYAYEGEVTGLIIERASEPLMDNGVIYCSEGDGPEKETRLLRHR